MGGCIGTPCPTSLTCRRDSGLISATLTGKAKIQSTNRNQSHDDETSSSRLRSNSCAPNWSDLNNDLLVLVMMQLGYGDYFSFRGVCKPWRLLALSNKNKFMESKPPMPLTISKDSNEHTCCYLEDFEGRKFKTILPDFSEGDFFGFTCGYLIFFIRETLDFCLLDPVTNKQLHFPDFPSDSHLGIGNRRAILVFSPSLSGLVFVVLCIDGISFSIEGKGAWKSVSYTFPIIDLYAFKGEIYALSPERRHLCELRLNPEPKFTLLETKNLLSSKSHYPSVFVSSGENLFVIGRGEECRYIREVDVGKMKWVKPCEKTMEDYAFFYSFFNHIDVAVNRNSWADPLSQSRGEYTLLHNPDNNTNYKLFIAMMWYFPHQCMNVDHLND